MGDNAYVIDLSNSLQISPTFNIVDLCEYYPMYDGLVFCEYVDAPSHEFNTNPGGTLLQEKGNDTGT